MNYSYFRSLLVVLLLSFTTSIFAQLTAPNITITDLDGTDHELYAYLDSGYQVILDFSYELCGPCYDWSVNIGHGLWEEHGPDGDNTLRMFHIDVYPVTDQSVSEYTQSWGIEYMVVNLPDNHPSYPVSGYPALFFICPDKTFSESGGYGYPSSQIAAEYYIEKCNGTDLSSNYSFFSATEATPANLCSDSLVYSPSITVIRSGAVEFPNGNTFFEDEYDVQIFINGIYNSTQTVDPWADNSVGTYSDESVLEPFPVNLNDEVSFVINFEGDNFPDDDTVHVTMPSSANTETSTTETLIVEADDAVFYDVYDSNNEFVLNGEGNSEFNLPSNNCYSIVFNNSHVYPAVLKDAATGAILCSYEVGDYVSYETPRLFFNVSKTVGIEEEYFITTIKDSYFLDLLGKRFEIDNHEHLTQGVYLKVTEYKNGDKQVVKVLQSDH